jgi:hypothetical protein
MIPAAGRAAAINASFSEACRRAGPAGTQPRRGIHVRLTDGCGLGRRKLLRKHGPPQAQVASCHVPRRRARRGMRGNGIQGRGREVQVVSVKCPGLKVDFL